MKNILKKLLELQKEVGAIKKDSTNPFFHSAYFDINTLIEALKPTLNKLGLVIYQPVECKDNQNIIKTIVADCDSGEMIESSINLPSDLEPQKMGSAITYLRRYSLQSLLFLQAEDDDGSTASPRNTGNATKRATTAVRGTMQPKTAQNAPQRQTEGNSDTKKTCPYCSNEHQGKYPKCMDCWKLEKDGQTLTKTKTIINEDAPPFVGDEYSK